MGDFWRGTITSRRLQVLIDGLPHDSAFHRTFHDGHEWTHLHAMVWSMHQQLEFMQLLLFSVVQEQNPKRARRIKPPKAVPYPWSKRESDQKRVGRVAPEDRGAALQYLSKLSGS